MSVRCQSVLSVSQVTDSIVVVVVTVSVSISVVVIVEIIERGKKIKITYGKIVVSAGFV